MGCQRSTELWRRAVRLAMLYVRANVGPALYIVQFLNEKHIKKLFFCTLYNILIANWSFVQKFIKMYVHFLVHI